MNGFNDFGEPVLFQNVSIDEGSKTFSVPVAISVLKKGECHFCPESRGFIVIEEKLENGQVLTKLEACPVCKGRL